MNYEIYEANLKTVTAKLARLNAKLARVNVPVVTYTVTGRFTKPNPSVPNTVLPFVTLEVEAATPKTNGWSFLATIGHTSEGNVIRSVPGFTVPADYRDKPTFCDHCRCNRIRRDTYVIQHDDGRTMQVGSNCLQEFLGVASNGVAKAADLILAARDVLESAKRTDWLGGNSEMYTFRIDLDTYLSHVAAVVLADKRYVTRKMTCENPALRSTSDKAYENMRTNKRTYVVTEEATKLATDARNSVTVRFSPEMPTFTDETSDSDSYNSLSAFFSSVDKNISDFEHNLYTCARSESIEPRFCGIAAYIIEYYRKEQAKHNPVSSTTLDGTGLARIFEMLNKAKEKIKYPAIRLNNDQGLHLNISLAGAASRNAGCIYVKSANDDGTYYGKVTTTCEFVPSRECPATVKAMLVEFAKNPEQVATRYGRATGCCCFCGRSLLDERSTNVGYGPVCAKRFGLEWGIVEVSAEVVETVAA